jgi:signal transduction histidine kinase
MSESSTSSVLLVDDQPAKLLTYQVILSQLDVRLVTASSAREALENLLKGDFAVVLIDVCMPELDGFELAALIREHPRFRTTAIIFVSGVHLSDLDRIRGYELGAMDYVPVPVIPEILRAKVKAFVDLHRTTRQLERLNAELEERVAERTAELQLASERKDEFLAVLAHELRNPLAAIHTASQVIDVANMDSAQRSKVGAVIQRQVTHLVRLIDDLIDMSRISRGVIGLRRERVGIGPIIEQAVESTRPALDARGHRLAVHTPEHGPDVFGDGARLAQVFGNLLTNAAKFTPPGGDITLRVTQEADAVVIRVTDTGVGVDPSKLSYIFELFTQADQPDGHSASGLGIGLALVRRIVEMHEGQVSAHSLGAGTGTEVTVRLPALAPPLLPSPEPTVVEVDTPKGPAGTRILVVDDNADAAFVLALMLRHAGHTVEIAGNGEQALRTGPAFDPRVVLLDLGMPGMDGFETARRIRQQRWGQGVVLVAVTGWGLPEDRRRTQAAGFNAHMVKPVNDDELLGVLDDLLTRSAQ